MPTDSDKPGPDSAASSQDSSSHGSGFGHHAEHWWDRNGPLRTLHAINPVRLDYIDARRPLTGKQVLDLGCGGGLLCEAMAARGARVTGADVADELIAAARAHADSHGLTIDYRTAESGDLVRQATRFDVITCLEMLEHVADPGQVIADCAQLLQPGGDLFLSTLNRTATAYALAIIGAEYLTGLLPRGTHDYQYFIKPAELAACCRANGFEVLDISGLGYIPEVNRAYVSRNTAVNYLLHARLRS